MSRVQLATCSILALIAILAGGAHAETVRLKGRRIVVDDALFTGCFHNAFEGKVLNPSEGVYKSGRQAIRRTKGVLSGAGATTSRMALRFSLERVPDGKTTLSLKGIDDRFEEQCPLDVSLNGKPLAEGVTFPNNASVRLKLNQRYFVGWEERTLEIPAGALRAGENTLTIANTRSIFTAVRWPYAIVDEVAFEFAAEAEVAIERTSYPPLYYGLTEGVEVNVWPAVNYYNRICLVRDAAIEYNFFATMPREKPLGTLGSLAKEPTRPKREILLHLLMDANVKVLALDGAEVQGKRTEGGVEFTLPIDRLINYETPHPAQGVRVFLVANAPFEGKELAAWYSVDGVAYRKRTYPFRAVALEPVAGREKIDFLLSLWGGGAPKDPEMLKRYVALLKGAGFNHQFTGNTPELNRTLKDAGFAVYPRYGWFARQFKVTDANREHASVDFRGKPSTRDFCPLAILDHPDEKEMGKFFARAERLAALPDIDGICVDYETGAVWCWCDRCLDAFGKETGIAIEGRGDVAPDGAHADAYRDFGRRLNRKLLTKVKSIMLAQNPDLQYHCLASAADLPTYWYDGRMRGRHSVQELVKFADAVYGSHYCYETPGGLKSVIPVVRTVKRFAVDSGRNVGANLITPVATTVSEYPRYRGVTLRPDMVRLMILLTAASGGGGLSLFRGDCMDGEQYVACRRAIGELVSLAPYVNGIDRSFEVQLTPAGPGARPDFHTDIAQNLLSRFVWRPDFAYQYDVVQLLKDKLARDRVLLLFNYSDGPVSFRLAVRGLYDPAYALREFATDKDHGRFSRLELAAGKPTVTVPARDCLILRMTAEEVN